MTTRDSLRVIVFGGAGFLGSYVADALTEAGHRVLVYDRIPSPYLRPDQDGVVADILDEKAVTAAICGCDVVYNYAGIADIERASREPLDAIKTNIVGNSIILEASRQAAVKRYVFASTLYVYSTAGSFYRCTKQACELIIDDYQQAFGLPYTILRYGSLYGPRAGDGNWIWRILHDAIVTGRIRREGDGQDVREYIHAWDAARSSVDILSPEFINTHVIISGQQSIRVRDLLNMVRAILGDRVEIEYVPADDETAAARPALHYSVTPYTFSPKIAKKIVRNSYVDLGQGLLHLIDELYRSEHKLREAAGVFLATSGDVAATVNTPPKDAE